MCLYTELTCPFYMLASCVYLNTGRFLFFLLNWWGANIDSFFPYYSKMGCFILGKHNFELWVKCHLKYCCFNSSIFWCCCAFGTILTSPGTSTLCWTLHSLWFLHSAVYNRGRCTSFQHVPVTFPEYTKYFWKSLQRILWIKIRHAKLELLNNHSCQVLLMFIL